MSNCRLISCDSTKWNNLWLFRQLATFKFIRWRKRYASLPSHWVIQMRFDYFCDSKRVSEMDALNLPERDFKALLNFVGERYKACLRN